MSDDFELEKNTDTVCCPSCGAQLTYDIATGKLKCDHCGHTQEIENNDSVERRQLTDDILRQKTEWTEGTVYRCDQCGAKGVLHKNSLSMPCPFCGSTNIVSASELVGLRPDAVLPFNFNGDRARAIFEKWISRKWLAPRHFKTADIREHIGGLYLPSWSFTAYVEALYKGTLGKTVTTSSRSMNGTIRYNTHIRYFNVSGVINQQYNDHLVPSATQISPINFNRLLPFNLTVAKAYKPEYLTGIPTEHYSRDLGPCFDDFSTFIRRDLRQKIMNKHGADTVRRLDINLNYRDKKFNYLLLPIYVAHYLYGEKNFNFFINGISGKIVGKYPRSRIKILLLSLLGITIVGVVGFLFWYFR